MADFSCPHYEPAEGRTCKHYADERCGLTPAAACIEWLLANGQSIPKNHPLVVRDLAGDLTMRQPPTTDAPKIPAADSMADEDIATPFDCLRLDDIDSFKRLGVVVHFVFDYGEFWLVPEYTGSERMEISVRDAATLFWLLSSFPGTKVQNFEKLP